MWHRNTQYSSKSVIACQIANNSTLCTTFHFRLTATLYFSLTAKTSLYWPFATHINDVIMGTIASQITSLTIVHSIIYSDGDQGKHQSASSLAFRGIHRGPVNFPHKWPVTRKLFPFDDVIMEVNPMVTSDSRHKVLVMWNMSWAMTSSWIPGKENVTCSFIVAGVVYGT